MLMKSRIQLLLVFVIFCCTTAMAQIQVKGTVVSANDSEPMIGVAIREEGTTNSCITDLMVTTLSGCRIATQPLPYLLSVSRRRQSK